MVDRARRVYRPMLPLRMAAPFTLQAVGADGLGGAGVATCLLDAGAGCRGC
jgi:hypothetical protein